MLIDEYDSPINSFIDRPTVLQGIQDTIRAFYKTTKALDDYLSELEEMYRRILLLGIGVLNKEVGYQLEEIGWFLVSLLSRFLYFVQGLN